MEKKHYCFIQEYDNGMKARLIEKSSMKKISLQIQSHREKQHFLEFLSSAKIISLDVYNEKSTDAVLVAGDVISDSDNEIVLANNKNLTYIFV